MDQLRLVPGASLGRYEILEHLASGGMAEVYLARRTGIGGFQKQVVIKTIRSSLAEEDSYVRMFLDEARIAGSVNHANVAAVYEAEEVDGIAFLVMEYVPGPSMNRLVRYAEQRERKSRVGAAWLIAGAARGLHCVHSTTLGDGHGTNAELVHRDVSLDNILAAKDGTAKVIDFGIATARARLTATEGDVIKGKLGYVAPEQIHAHEADYRSDLYALGVCLYRATVGQPPFPTTNAHATLLARTRNQFKTPREVDPDYPEELEAIVLRAMRVDPTERQASCAVFANELEAWIRTLRPDFDPSEVAAWIDDCFESEEEWRPRPQQPRSQPSAHSLASAVEVAPPTVTPITVRSFLPAIAVGAASGASVAVLTLAIAFVAQVPHHDDVAVAASSPPPGDDVPGELPPDEPVPSEAVVAEPVTRAPPAVAVAVAQQQLARPVTGPLVASEAEAFVADALVADGWTVTARDWRSGLLHVDLIVERAGIVRFVDVQIAEKDVAPKHDKKQLAQAAELWRTPHPKAVIEYADAVVASGGKGRAPKITWVPLP